VRRLGMNKSEEGDNEEEEGGEEGAVVHRIRSLLGRQGCQLIDIVDSRNRLIKISIGWLDTWKFLREKDQ
jgi:hypothetical protein